MTIDIGERFMQKKRRHAQLPRCHVITTSPPFCTSAMSATVFEVPISSPTIGGSAMIILCHWSTICTFTVTFTFAASIAQGVGHIRSVRISVSGVRGSGYGIRVTCGCLGIITRAGLLWGRNTARLLPEQNLTEVLIHIRPVRRPGRPVHSVANRYVVDGGLVVCHGYFRCSATTVYDRSESSLRCICSREKAGKGQSFCTVGL